MGCGKEPGYVRAGSKKLADLARVLIRGGEAEILCANQDLWEVVSIAPNQWRVGFSGCYALDYNVIVTIADRLGVMVDFAFLEKLRIFERAALDEIMSPAGGGEGGGKKQKCTKAQRERCEDEFGEHLQWACSKCEQR
ncbi:hypothetical protein KsCSTR_18700 [Candidatus Kuenenia stuttgartiensis]|uniref:Uncharacterized protein n=1 Tax=Kuenenia stuttgartiensis TaxID=174633 RepID=A0A6G7GPL6_KUEST|nr:DUF1799 domain-containing protein [Candidatus Kuenenia stuttgartiensis]QII11249.1 hypothetical protein KsCSTR_18700 [Candidatus Kuenenia stuttgartiensis]